MLVRLDPHAGTATVDRGLLGTGEGGTCSASFRPGPHVDPRILVDHSWIEVFVDGGRLVMSARIYPDPQATSVVVTAIGAPAVVDLTCYPMAPT
ncbi:MAG: GH32 C-terminal domain-containing protein [Candidatus Nanopelagicales bacterium]